MALVSVLQKGYHTNEVPHRGCLEHMENFSTNQFSKIFDMLIFQRKKQHVVNHNILVPEQHGFPNGASTDTATYKLSETVFKG